MPKVRIALVSASWLGLWIATACWAQPAWEPSGPWPDDYPGALLGQHDPREGRIEATQFVAKSPAARALGQGAISVASGPDNMTIGSEDESFRTAVAEQLGKIGYTLPAGPGAQIAEVSVRHALVQPPEHPHSPVAGGLAVGGGNRGSGVGVAIALDFSKPLKALVATRLEARIRDSVTKEILWEGYAEVLTREGDKHWTTQALSSRLAAALFKGFPHLS